MGLPRPDALDEVFARYPVTLSIAQCAELLGLRPLTVYRRLKLPPSDPRRIPGHRPGGPGWTIYRDEIKAYVRRGENHPDDDPPRDTP